MWFLPVISIAALFGAVTQVTGGDPATEEIVLNMVIGLASGGFFVLLYRQRKDRNEFFEWLAEHAPEVARGGANYKDHWIRLDTELRSFQTAFSILVLCFKYESRPYIADEEPRFATGVLYTLTALVFGWWGIPWGPIWTIESVLRNVSGGRKTTVGDYLEESVHVEPEGVESFAAPRAA